MVKVITELEAHLRREALFRWWRGLVGVSSLAGSDRRGNADSGAEVMCLLRSAPGTVPLSLVTLRGIMDVEGWISPALLVEDEARLDSDLEDEATEVVEGTEP